MINLTGIESLTVTVCPERCPRCGNPVWVMPEYPEWHWCHTCMTAVKVAADEPAVVEGGP